ncbi:MAG: Pycsar system effector family protein [Cytophagaceae bacterium]
MDKENTIIKEAEIFVFNYLNDNLDSKFTYHNYAHASDVVTAAEEIAGLAKIDPQEKEILLLAAWFHDCGYAKSVQKHEEMSAGIARDYLLSINYPDHKIQKVVQCIMSTRRDIVPQDKLEKILCDADLCNLGKEDFCERADLLRLEWENLEITTCSELEWDETQLKFLLNSKYYTPEANQLYLEEKNKNISRQKKRIRKKSKDRPAEKSMPKRGVETMFRSVYRNHINLSSIADNKANMMISINTIIISIMLTIVGAKFSFFGSSLSENPALIFPAITLIITSLGSVVFAILSAKPKITGKPSEGKSSMDSDKKSILFFGNYTQLTVESFEKKMSEIMQEESLLYGNMIRDLYSLGKVLDKKYQLLGYSYTFFMFGLIITVFEFVTILVYLKVSEPDFSSLIF